MCLWMAGDAKKQDLRAHQAILAKYLRPGETFLDLRNQSAKYVYLNLPSPITYPATYNAPLSDMQKRMIAALEGHLPPVVFLGPASNFDAMDPALRTYLLYKFLFLQNYTVKEESGITFLVEKERDSAPLPGEKQAVLIEPTFHKPDLAFLPEAWGRSFSGMKNLFTLSTEFLDKFPANSPAIYLNLSKEVWKGSQVDWLYFESTCTPVLPATPLVFQAALKDSELTPPTVLTFSVRASHTGVLLPLGSYPKWLQSPHVSGVEIRVGNPQVCSSYTLDKFAFYEKPYK